MANHPQPDPVTLPPEFSETERGNVWLISEELTGHNIWIRLEGDNWLEIAIRTENYPGLTVQTVKTTEERLARHIKKECQSMYIRKINLPGFDRLKEGDELHQPEGEYWDEEPGT